MCLGDALSHRRRFGKSRSTDAIVSDCPSHCLDHHKRPSLAYPDAHPWMLHSLEHTAKMWLKHDKAFDQATVSICGHVFLVLHTYINCGD